MPVKSKDTLVAITQCFISEVILKHCQRWLIDGQCPYPAVILLESTYLSHLNTTPGAESMSPPQAGPTTGA